MKNQDRFVKDELRARFTVWLETTVYHAKLNYLKKQQREIETVSMEELPESVFEIEDQEIEWLDSLLPQDAFVFEEENLARAFAELPLMRQSILTMLFVEEKKPEEIAKKLHCSVQHVYNQRSLALKKLRKMLIREDEIL